MIDIERDLPHAVSVVICVMCSSRWVATRPSDVLLKELECSKCGKGSVIETGQVIT